MATTTTPPATRAARVPRPGDVMRRLADGSTDGSFSNSRRTRRFEAFAEIVDGLHRRLGRQVRILDIGGTNEFWEQRGWGERDDVHVVLVNLEAEERTHANLEPRIGDATDLAEFPDGSFDVVFSNSVIEHLQTYDRQAAMAAEVRRLAPVFWIQTPNFWFPVEPHFLTPAWHWLPVAARVALLKRRRWGWRGPCPETDAAQAAVREIRLMRRGELHRLFPDATLRPEKIGPLVKSFVAVQT
jgi:Methyltransferase domain